MSKLALSRLLIDKEFLKKIIKNLEYNKSIMRYYQRYYEKSKHDVILKKIDRMKDCNKIWQLDKYEIQKVKVFKKTSLCKDKFCNNCKKVKQASRMARFIPEIQKYKEDGLYQLVLTNPNVAGEELRDTIKKMFKAFFYLQRYFNGKAKIKGLDFSYLDYKGALRSLEVTYKGNSYHAHMHAVLCLRGELGVKDIKNQYSVDHTGKRLDRLFSKEEELIQKIWYLLLNEQKVTLKAIEQLDIGYSCMMDEFKETDYLELFKYITKGNGSAVAEEEVLMSYDNFEVLYKSLDGVRQIQGYGCFFRFSDDDMENEVDEMFIDIQKQLQEIEKPQEVYETPEALEKDKHYNLISRAKIYEYVRQL